MAAKSSTAGAWRRDVDMIEVRLTRRRLARLVPFIGASEVGYSGHVADLQRRPGTGVTGFAEWIRDSSDGPYVALVDSPPARRPIGLIQSNRGPFYRNRHTRNDVVWRDFYYAVLHTALSRADARWYATSVELAHPTGDPGWRDDILIILHEVLRHLEEEGGLNLRRVYLSCLGDLTAERVDAARQALHEEIGAGAAAGHRPLVVSVVKPNDVEAPQLPDASLLRIDLSGVR